uniref:Uncharacterized protein n=1 Tax=Hucho hucho TaxID=62062 RepID=A0A4W5ME67_9TELE
MYAHSSFPLWDLKGPFCFKVKFLNPPYPTLFPFTGLGGSLPSYAPLCPALCLQLFCLSVSLFVILPVYLSVCHSICCSVCQESLKGSVSGAMRTGLRSYTDVCDAVFAMEIGLRFLGKTSGVPKAPLLSYLTESLKMGPQISSSVAKVLGESRLEHSTFTWQLLTCWKSELMLSRGQDPFHRLPSEFQQKLSEEERRELRVFFSGTDIDILSLELHEILLLKTNIQTFSDQAYLPHWE